MTVRAFGASKAKKSENAFRSLWPKALKSFGMSDDRDENQGQSPMRSSDDRDQNPGQSPKRSATSPSSATPDPKRVKPDIKQFLDVRPDIKKFLDNHEVRGCLTTGLGATESWPYSGLLGFL